MSTCFPADMVLKPESRWPLKLPEMMVEEVLQRPLAVAPPGRVRQGKRVSIVVVTFNNLVFNRLCLEFTYHTAPDYSETVNPVFHFYPLPQKT